MSKTLEVAQQSKRKLATAITICVLASFFYIYDYFIQVAPSIMTKQLMHDFAIGAGGLGILSACFYYSYTLMQIPAGMLLDKIGARKLLTISVLISATGVMLFSTARLFAFAGLGRFFIGLGSAFAFISALFLVSRWFPHKHFAMIAGLIQLGACLGSMFGLAPLALLVNHYGWRNTMINTGLITFLLAFIFWMVIRDGKPSTDLKQIHMKSSWQQLKILTGYSQVWWTALCGLASWVPVTVIGALWCVPYLMRLYGWNNIEAGQVCNLFWLGLALGSPAIGWYSAKIKQRCRPLFFCFTCGLIASLVIIFAKDFPHYFIGIALFLLGFSAAAQSLSFGLIKDIVPSEMFGMASGFNNMAAILGGGIAQPLVGFLLQLNWQGHTINHTPVYAISDYQTAFILLPFAAIIGILVTRYKIKETFCEKQL